MWLKKKNKVTKLLKVIIYYYIKFIIKSILIILKDKVYKFLFVLYIKYI